VTLGDEPKTVRCHGDDVNQRDVRCPRSLRPISDAIGFTERSMKFAKRLKGGSVK